MSRVVLCAGLTYGQVDNLSCGTFCLSSQTTCTCSVTGGILAWEVKDENDATLGVENLSSGDLNMPTTLTGAPAFQVLLTSVTTGPPTTLTATLNFTTLSEYGGYTVSCDATGIPELVTISIPGINW